MSERRVRYVAGATCDFTTAFVRRSIDMSEVNSSLVARFLEIWCHEECIGPWQIEETDREIVVRLIDPVDTVKFRLSSESDAFETS